MTHSIDTSIESRATEFDQVPNMVSVSGKYPETNVRVQLRPVGHPSPVTQLFEYTLKAWDGQKGDHCTYKYTSSRDSHMEMSATVLVRLPNKPSLLVKDSKFRQSRVLAQNAVANLALQKLAQDDPELKEKLDQMAKEVEERKAAALADANAPPPPPPPSRFTTEPHHFHWSSNVAPRVRRHHHFASSQYPGFHHQVPPQASPYYAPGPAPHYYPPGPYMPLPLQPSRSTSAPELVVPAEVPSEAYPSYDPATPAVMTPSGYYHHHPSMEFAGYPQPPLVGGDGSDSTPSTEAGPSPPAVDEISPHPSIVPPMPQWAPHWGAPYYPMPQPPSPHHYFAPAAMIQPDFHYFQYMQPDEAAAMMMYGGPGGMVNGASPIPQEGVVVGTNDEDGSREQQSTTTALCH